MAKKIQGHIAEGYEPVIEYLEKMMNSSCEDNIQMCVYVNKTCVIDLYGSSKNDLNYNSDTMQVRKCFLKILLIFVFGII